MKLRFDESELSGRYFQGAGLDVLTLELFIDHRFSFVWHGCLGEYDRNQGKWAMDGDILVLEPERLDGHDGLPAMKVRFIPVRWGQRHLAGADLSGAILVGATLTQACLRRAILVDADLRGAALGSADLKGANLTGARYDSQTRWPKSFDPERAGAVKVERDD